MTPKWRIECQFRKSNKARTCVLKMGMKTILEMILKLYLQYLNNIENLLMFCN